MSDDPIRMLKRLEPPIRPGTSPHDSSGPRPAFESQSFEQLLQLVSSGGASDARTVDVAFEPSEPLDESQMQRLAGAANVAESAQVERALLFMDGRALVLDVNQRALTDELTAENSTPLVHVEAAVFVAGDQQDQPVMPRGPSAGVLPPGLAEQFEDRSPEGGRIPRKTDEEQPPPTRAAG